MPKRNRYKNPLGRQPQQRRSTRPYHADPDDAYTAGYSNLPVSRNPGPEGADLYVRGLEDWLAEASDHNHATCWRWSVGLPTAAATRTERGFDASSHRSGRSSLTQRQRSSCGKVGAA